MIKPNVASWRYINVSNAFNVSLKMNDEGNRYGFTSLVDTHMMKNSEWAVVSYLSQSKYGKLGNKEFIGVNKEVYQNKSNSFMTGCSYGSPSNENTDYGCQYTYDMDINGTGSSTTGNIYGIYDMSGGSWEYVMGNYNDIISESGFVSMPESKYYDKYTSENVNTACNGNECLSHGLSETPSWYDDYIYMVSGTYSWPVRGGYYGDTAVSGIFFFGVNSSGSSDISYSFRLVMSPSI